VRKVVRKAKADPKFLTALLKDPDKALSRAGLTLTGPEMRALRAMTKGKTIRLRIDSRSLMKAGIKARAFESDDWPSPVWCLEWHLIRFPRGRAAGSPAKLDGLPKGLTVGR
jgi:hypothetical protein